MMNAKDALAMILKGLEPAAQGLGLKMEQEDGTAFLRGGDNVFRIVLADDRAVLEQQKDEVEHEQMALSLLELGRADERDCKYIAGEFAEALEKLLKVRKPGTVSSSKKPPKSVSKKAIRNGDAYYDALSFANSFTGIYPELRAAFKENYDRHGSEFLPEEFFLRQGGNDVVMKTIRSGDQQQMKRLFNLFNDVYENGVNDVQSLVVVTIMGALKNDERLLASCVDYMSTDLAPVVIRVNALLATNAGKKAKKKLENPPLYKPKKEKKPGLFQQIMSGGGQMPGM